MRENPLKIKHLLQCQNIQAMAHLPPLTFTYTFLPSTPQLFFSLLYTCHWTDYFKRCIVSCFLPRRYLKYFTEQSLSLVMKKRAAAPHAYAAIRASLTLQTPHATVHSSDVADAWFAWHSMPVKTKIKHTYAGVEDVRAIPTGRFLHYEELRWGNSLFSCIYYIRKCQEPLVSWVLLVWKYQIKMYFILLSFLFYMFSIPKLQTARVVSSSISDICLLSIL